MPMATRIYLTRVAADVEGDTVFPPLEEAQWQETESVRSAADERNAYDMMFVTLERVPASGR
jgi:dihydrofolate reductase